MYKDLVKRKEGLDFENYQGEKGNNSSNTLLKIIIFLTVLQFIRIVSKKIVFLFLDFNKFNNYIITIIIMILISLFTVYKSKKENISLNIFSFMESKESKSYYTMVTIAILVLIITSPIYNKHLYKESIIFLIYSAVVIPIYEGIIFRSYIWSKLEKEYDNEWKAYLVSSILFSIWNIGYIDNIVIISGFDKIGWLLFTKCSIMFTYGIIIGYFKYKIKNSYSSMLIHSFINILVM